MPLGINLRNPFAARAPEKEQKERDLGDRLRDEMSDAGAYLRDTAETTRRQLSTTTAAASHQVDEWMEDAEELADQVRASAHTTKRKATAVATSIRGQAEELGDRAEAAAHTTKRKATAVAASIRDQAEELGDRAEDRLRNTQRDLSHARASAARSVDSWLEDGEDLVEQVQSGVSDTRAHLTQAAADTREGISRTATSVRKHVTDLVESDGEEKAVTQGQTQRRGVLGYLGSFFERVPQDEEEDESWFDSLTDTLRGIPDRMRELPDRVQDMLPKPPPTPKELFAKVQRLLNGNLKEAETIALSIKDNDLKELALKNLALRHIEKQSFQDARRLARLIKNTTMRIKLHLKITLKQIGAFFYKIFNKLGILSLLNFFKKIRSPNLTKKTK